MVTLTEKTLSEIGERFLFAPYALRMYNQNLGRFSLNLIEIIKEILVFIWLYN